MIFIKYLIFHFNTSMAQKVESFFFLFKQSSKFVFKLIFQNKYLKITNSDQFGFN